MNTLQAYKYLSKHPDKEIEGDGMHIKLNNGIFEYWWYSPKYKKWKVVRTYNLEEFQITFRDIEFEPSTYIHDCNKFCNII